VSDISHETTIKILNDVAKKIIILKNEGFRVQTIEKLVIKVRKALKAKKTDNLIMTINELNVRMENINKYSDELLELVSDCQKNFELAGQMGAETKQSEKLYIEAQELFNAEKFNQAISKVKECKKRLNDSLFLFITDEFKKIYTHMKQLPKNIIQSRDIQRMFNDVDAAIQDNYFELAWKNTLLLKEVKDRISKPILEKLRETAKDSIIDFQNRIDEARKKGADLTDAREVFIELVKRMQEASDVIDYKEVIDYTSAGKHALERAIRRKLRCEGQTKEVQENLDRLILDSSVLKDHCAIPGSVEDSIEKAKKALSDNNFETALEIVKTCTKKLDKLRSGSEPAVELKIEVRNLQPNLWNRTKISITNGGLATAEDVDIKLSGPLEVRRMPEIDKLMYNTTETFEIGLKPEGAGSVPVDIDIQFIRSWDGKPYHEHHDFWMDISGLHDKSKPGTLPSEAVQSTPGRDKKSSSGIDCPSCNQEIEKSVPIFKCSCGTIYHLDCISDLNDCLKCNAPIRREIDAFTRPRPEIVDQDDDEVDWD
jgi:hypothetical protein